MVQTQIQTLKYEQSITISKVGENNFDLNIKIYIYIFFLFSVRN